jgi:hypothetical protein
MGVTPGETTGWAVITVPRASVFFGEPPEIIEWFYGIETGPIEAQAVAIARTAIETQSLDYKCGPALIVESYDPYSEESNMPAADMAGMLRLLKYQGRLGDCTINFQPMQATFKESDDKMRKLGLLVRDSEPINYAARHAIVGLRRARSEPGIAKLLWPYKLGWYIENVFPEPDYEYPNGG